MEARRGEVGGMGLEEGDDWGKEKARRDWRVMRAVEVELWG